MDKNIAQKFLFASGNFLFFNFMMLKWRKIV